MPHIWPLCDPCLPGTWPCVTPACPAPDPVCRLPAPYLTLCDPSLRWCWSGDTTSPTSRSAVGTSPYSWPPALRSPCRRPENVWRRGRPTSSLPSTLWTWSLSALMTSKLALCLFCVVTHFCCWSHAYTSVYKHLPCMEEARIRNSITPSDLTNYVLSSAVIPWWSDLRQNAYVSYGDVWALWWSLWVVPVSWVDACEWGCLSWSWEVC